MEAGMPNVSILLIDPSPISREGLHALLERAGFTALGMASRGVDEIDPGEVAGMDPDMVLADLNADADLIGAELAKLRAVFPRSKLVVLSARQDIDFLNACFSTAVDGFVSRHTSTRVMMQSLHLILADERVFPSKVVDLLLANARPRPVPVESEEAPERDERDDAFEIPLSEREIEIMQCLVAGHSNKAIAGYLDVTEATVKVHLKSILRKIQVNNRTQAAIWGIRHGIAPHAPRQRATAGSDALRG
jgi:two-component system nitrate/nitrite response regulator NarL